MKCTNKNTVFRSLLISYTFILLLPLLSSSLVFMYTLHSLNTHLSDISMLTVSQLQKITDLDMEKLNKDCDAVFMQPQTQSLKYESDYPFSTKKIILLKQLQDYISSQVASNSLISDIYIHFLNSDTILSAGNFYHGNEFTSKVKDSLLVDYNTYRSLLDFDGYRQYKMVEQDGLQSIFIMQKNSVTSKGRQPDIVVTLIINITEFQKVLNQIGDGQEYHASIIDAEGHVFAEDKILYEPNLNYDIPKENHHNTLFYYLWKNRPITAQIQSMETTWTYQFTLPTDHYMNVAKKDIAIMLLCTITSLIVGILLCYYMSQKQYAPLKQLVNKILQHMKNSTSDTTENEYSLIEKSILYFVQEKQLSEKELENYHIVLKEKIVRNLLLGNTTYAFRHTKSKELDLLDLRYDNFIVFLFNCNNDGQCIDKSGSSVGILLSIIKHMLSSLFLDYGIYHVVNIGNDIICLLNLPDSTIDKANFYQMLEQNFMSLQNHLYQKTNMDMCVAISNMHFSIDSVSTAYQEVLDIQDYIRVTGINKPVLFYSAVNIDDTECEALPEFMEEQRMLFNLLRSKDFEKSREVFDKIMVRFMEHTSSLSEIKVKMSYLIQTLVAALGELKSSFPVSFYEDVNPIQVLYHSQSLKSLQDNMNIIFNELINHFDHEKNNIWNKRNTELIQYVDEHYMDPSISIVQVADEFHLSTSYISRMFKKLTGNGFLDYIHLKRIKKAKEYIAQGILIKDIPPLLGYTNSLSLIRAFRRYEGISPSEYRNTLINKAQKG